MTPPTLREVFRKVKSFFFSSQKQTFKNSFLPAVRPGPNQVFNVGFIKGLKFLTRIRLGLSQLAGHKSRHNF